MSFDSDLQALLAVVAQWRTIDDQMTALAMGSRDPADQDWQRAEYDRLAVDWTPLARKVDELVAALDRDAWAGYRARIGAELRALVEPDAGARNALDTWDRWERGETVMAVSALAQATAVLARLR